MVETMPLEGIRVLDMATVLAGPVTTTMLGDFGAEVIKVELPGRGDTTRERAKSASRRSPTWLQEGRNKRSVTLDLHRAEGQSLLRRLAATCDVVVENFRPGVAETWQVDAGTLRAEQPRLIVLRLSGYGQTGPYREKPAFDRVAQAFAGTTYATGFPEKPPVRDGYALADYMAAYLGAYAVMLALYRRDARGGEGQVIDLALYEPVFRASEGALINYSLSGQVRERGGNRNPGVVPADNFLSADGVWVVIHAGSDSLWRRLAGAMGRDDLLEDERFRTVAGRIKAQDDLYPEITRWAASLPASDIVQRLEHAGVPVERVRSIADIVADRHFYERGNIVEFNDDEYGRVLIPGVIPALSATPGRIRSLGPALGAHTDEVLRDLGLSAAEIAQLRAEGTI